MSKVLEVGIGADTGPFDKAVRSGIIDPLEDVDKALKDLGERGTDRLERELDHAADATEKLEDKTKDAARAIEREYRDGYDSAKRSARDGLDDMSSRTAEVGSELRQNLGETFSSFRGDLEDLPQIAQDTLGGLAGSGALGGIPGLVATAAGAAGLGLLIGAFQAIGEEQEALKEKTREWADVYMTEGSRVLSTATIIARGQAVLNDEYDTAEENSRNWGVSLETAVAAMAGSRSAIDEVSESMRGQHETAREAAIAAQELTAQNGGVLLSLTLEEEAARKGQSALDALTGSMDAGAARADILSRLMVDQARATAGATEKVDEFGDRIISLPDGTQVYVDAETGQATMDLDAIERKAFSVDGFTVNGKATLDTTSFYNSLAKMRFDAGKGVFIQAKGLGPLAGGYSWQ